MVSVPVTKTYPACNLVFVGEMEREKNGEMEREKKRWRERKKE